MLPRTLVALTCLTLAAACGGNEKRFAVPSAPIEMGTIRIAHGTVEVLEVSLPSYAADPEIAVRGPDGAVELSNSLLWADEPTRAVTLELTRYLGQATGARVASEPWPFYDPAQARVEVRVEEMLAEGATLFRMSGQYFVAPQNGGRDRSGLFSITAPIAPDGGAPAIAAARGAVVRDLALKIAREGLR